MADKSLIQKLVEASKAVGPVEKDGNNTYQGYHFQSETAIKHAVKEAIQQAGIAIVPSYEVINQYDRKTNKGGINHFVDVVGTFEITDGVQTITGKMPGSGQDTGEKAMAKACTTAQKYFYKQLFNITDKEEDPDSDNSKPDGGYKAQEKTEAATSKGLLNTINNLAATIAKSYGKTVDQVIGGFEKQTNSDFQHLTDVQAQNVVKHLTDIVNKLNQKQKVGASS